MDPKHHAEPEAGADQDPSDRELIDAVREGDLEAFDPLYRRHRESGLRHARYWARSEAAAEDLCAEAFTRVLFALRNGNGPTEAFRPYLLTTMRNAARDWAEGDRRTLLVPDVVEFAPPAADQDPVIAALERSLAGLAFSSLPERWQTVLWQTEVEQEAPAQLAAQLGIDAAAVSALAYRAREGLKQAYLQAHITEIAAAACRPFAERLGTHTRGKLRGREAAKVRGHLRHCSECVGLFAMLKYVNANLGALVGPAVLGTAAAIRVGVVLGGAAAGAGAGAGATAGGGAAQHGLVLRGLSKARHASPRQQAVAAGTTVALAAAALAFALTGNDAQPPPVAAARPSPSPVEPSPPPVARKVAPPTPKRRTLPPPVAPTSAPPAPKPAPATSAPPPASPAPASTAPAPSTPSPSPTPSPTVRELCPGEELTLSGADLRLPVELRLGLPLGRFVEVRIGGVLVTVNDTGDDDAVAPDCAGGGPPRPFPLPDLTAGADDEGGGT